MATKKSIKFNPDFCLGANDEQRLSKVKEVLELEEELKPEPGELFDFLKKALFKITDDEGELNKLHSQGITKHWLQDVYRKLTYHHFPNYGLLV